MATRSSVSLVNTLTIDQRKEFLNYARCRVTDMQHALSGFRTLLTYRDKAYQRTLNTTKEHIAAIRASLNGKPRALQDLTVPIVMPQVESATAYQAGVFLTSYPIFGVVSSKPDLMDPALKFETAIGDQSIRYGWARELIKIFRNGYKYNFGPACVTWKKTNLKTVVTDTSISAAGMAAIQEAAYGGNYIQAVDPYNCFMDPAVDPAEMHSKGEFFGWNELYTRIRLKQMIMSLDPQKTTQIKEAFESPFCGATTRSEFGMQYYTPEINPMQDLGVKNLAGITNWGAWLGLPGSQRSRIAYKDHYVVTHFFCRALGQDFGAPGNKPKIFHGIIINWNVVIFVEEMNVAHDLLPCVIMTPNDDGLGYQTQSMIDTSLPFQDMSSNLWNIAMESKRRLIFDRLIYNPKLIDKKDIDPVSSVSRVPLRNVNIGKENQNLMAQAVYQIPYREDNMGTNLQMSDMISAMADQAAGQNKVDRGQFQKGNKTKAEFETTMGNSNARQQLSAIGIEQQFMTPVKEIIKSNTLQFQASGKILNREMREVVDVDPVELRKAILEFKMTDGMLPADKMLNAEVLTVFMQTAQAIPGVAAEYDIMGMFIYWAKLRGAYWLEDFKRNPQNQQQFLNAVQGMTAATNPPPTAPAGGMPPIGQSANI